uniref:Odorant receptor n=1 Tax=Anopheles coluzzii TaxID=1518534 RepID=A0A8W7PZ53_ANOCL
MFRRLTHPTSPKQQNHRDRACDFTVMPHGLWLLEHSGLWGDPRRKRSFALMLLGTVLLLIVPKIVLGTGSDSFDSIARSTAEFIFCYNNYLMMAIFAIRRQPFEQLIGTVQLLFDKQRKFQTTDSSRYVVYVNRQIMRYSRLYIIVQGVYFLIFNLLPAIVTYSAYFASSGDGEPVEFLLPVESRFFFLDIRHSIVHYTVFSLLACPAFLFTAYLTVVKGLVFIGIIVYNTLQYQLVSRGVRELKSHDPTTTQFRHRLTEIIDQHGAATRCTKLLDSVLNLMLLVQFTNTVLMCCLFLFYISKNFNSGAVNVLLLFLALTVENLCFSYFGNRLSTENTSVARAVYSTDWYNYPPVLQKQFQQMIRHAYIPRGITVGKFHFVDMASFGQLLKAIFSYYLILKELF